MRSAKKSRITSLKIHGKDTLFDDCVLEQQLHKYVDVPRLLGLEIRDEELQREACDLVHAMDASLSNPSDMFVNFLTTLIYGSTGWLIPFRKRASLPVPENLTSAEIEGAWAAPDVAMNATYVQQLEEQPSNAGPNQESTDFLSLNDNNCYRRLARELSRFVATTMSPRNPSSHVPTDAELQYQARWIMFSE